MKLNVDCVRDILLYIEENQQFVQDDYRDNRTLETVSFYQIRTDEKLSKKYSRDDLEYTVLQLFKHNYIEGWSIPKGCNYITQADVDDISPIGHEFLNNVRNNKVWAKTKERLKGLGTVSLKFVGSIASGVLTEYFKNPELLENLIPKS